MRKKRLLFNIVFALSLQIITILCGFILPRIMLTTYGSEVNGLVTSIAQFLHVISFLELGIGAVVQSALYKPLAEKNNEVISRVLSSASKFFRTIGLILFAYVCVLTVVYPYVSHQEFGFVYTATLILAISISSFFQYYFGIVDGLLLNADQRGYIVSVAGIVTVVTTTAVCCIEMKAGATIHIVKLSASLIYLLRPAILRLYVNRHYSVSRRVKYDTEPIKQKWNGIAQHVSSVVLDQTDTIVLTLLATLSDVSIYSVYFLVVFGIKNLFFSVANGGVQSLLGELWAKKESENVRSVFSAMEWSIHTVVTYIYTCTAVLIVPFVMVYTRGVTDANYDQPLFAAALVMANAVHCLRLPYHIMIKAAGRYKETQSNYFISALINIVVSIIGVKLLGLVGVAVGTLVSMLFQTIWMAHYNSKELIKGSFLSFVKQMIINAVSVLLCVLVTRGIGLNSYTYPDWILMAVKVALINLALFALINVVFCRDKAKTLYTLLKRKK